MAAALAERRVVTPVARRRSRAWLAVAAAVLLVAIGAVGGYLAAPRSSVAAFLQQPGVTLVPFEQTAPSSGTMTLAIAPDGTEAYVIVASPGCRPRPKARSTSCGRSRGRPRCRWVV